MVLLRKDLSHKINKRTDKDRAYRYTLSKNWSEQPIVTFFVLPRYLRELIKKTLSLVYFYKSNEHAVWCFNIVDFITELFLRAGFAAYQCGNVLPLFVCSKEQYSIGF